MAAAVCVFAGCALAEIPAGYYTGLNGKTGADLKNATFIAIHNLSRISSYSDLPKYFQHTDVYPEKFNGRTRWWDMYSNIPFYAPSFSGLNREHSFPKSWWGGLTNVNAYTDLNHLYPSEMKANTAKSNYPLGVVDMRYTPNFDNGLVKVGYAITGQGGGAKYVFEPADEYKGDFARTYFYMVTCYQDYEWTPKYMYMLQQNTYPTLSKWAIDMLLEWAKNDPVSEKEIMRNEQVYMYQNNRNPFIDFPSLADYIWGSKVGEPFDISSAGVNPEPVGDPNLITPVQDMSLDFGQVAVGKSTTARLYFHGENLKGNLSVLIYGGNNSLFTITTSKIPTSLVNSEDGYWLTVTYTPTEVGEHTSRLLIKDGGITGSRGISLIGECLPTPTLTACVATDPSDITSDSYTANWTAPADEVIDYFVVTRTIYSGGTSRQEQLVAEQNSLEITDFDESDSESYSVQSARLGYLSPMSNVVFVQHAGITGVSGTQPLEALPQPGAVLIKCAAPHTNVCIYDPMGRLVKTVPTIDNNDEITLPSGIYLLTTAQHPAPLKLTIR